MVVTCFQYVTIEIGPVCELDLDLKPFSTHTILEDELGHIQ